MPRVASANTRWWWGALLVGGIALGWGIFARGSVRSDASAPSAREEPWHEGQRASAAAPAVGSSAKHAAPLSENESPICPHVRLFDVEVDQAGRVRGAWLASDETAPTMVELGAGFGGGTLARASLGGGERSEAWLRLSTGLCRVAFAEGDSLGRLLPTAGGATARPSASAPGEQTDPSARLRDMLALVRARMGRHNRDGSNDPAIAEARLASDAVDKAVADGEVANGEAPDGEAPDGAPPAGTRSLDAAKLRQISRLFGKPVPLADGNPGESQPASEDESGAE